MKTIDIKKKDPRWPQTWCPGSYEECEVSALLLQCPDGEYDLRFDASKCPVCDGEFFPIHIQVYAPENLKTGEWPAFSGRLPRHKPFYMQLLSKESHDGH